eukprot:GFYU01008517.1.p2 GENE.GFYU01008517.1~~GFYU01008517.1.p2  ORF type:complete len:140 (+),score=37.78 GFYU01008517.1:166-585(+)
MIDLSDSKKIGIGLTGGGLLFLLLGVLFFFDRAFLVMGNFMFLAGVTLVIGTQRTLRFFFVKKKIRGTSTFFVGMLMVLWGWPVIGMFIEIFGFFNLFGDFFPVVLKFLKNVPVIGQVFELPGVKMVVDRMIDKSGLPL